MNYTFIKNKYTLWYYTLIQNAQKSNRHKGTEYFEDHHIVPKSLGGNNLKSNRVLLTAKEHFIAHLLLIRMVQITDVYRMVNAIRRFKKKCKSSKEFNLLKSSISRFSKGILNPSYGKIWIHSIETKEILYVDDTDFSKLDQTKFKKGLPFQRGGHKNTIWINNGTEESCVSRSDFTSFDATWSIGRLNVPTLSHMKNMAKNRHTAEKDKAHSNKMSGKNHPNFGKSSYNKGMVHMNDGLSNKMIKSSDVEDFIIKGWTRGRLPKKVEPAG